MSGKYKRLFYNLILLCVLALLVAVTVHGFRSIDSLALEQKTRCGLQEHRHTDACYAADVLICTEKAHMKRATLKTCPFIKKPMTWGDTYDSY